MHSLLAAETGVSMPNFVTAFNIDLVANDRRVFNWIQTLHTKGILCAHKIILLRCVCIKRFYVCCEYIIKREQLLGMKSFYSH